MDIPRIELGIKVHKTIVIPLHYTSCMKNHTGRNNFYKKKSSL